MEAMLESFNALSSQSQELFLFCGFWLSLAIIFSLYLSTKLLLKNIVIMIHGHPPNYNDSTGSTNDELSININEED